MLIADMNIQVIYFSRAGQTKKIASTIASECNVESEDVRNASLHGDSFLFLGSGCYGGKAGKEMKKFIETNDLKDRSIALFGTSGGGDGKEVNDMNIMLNAKGADVKGTFFCKGKFFILNRDRPNDEDLENASKFAKNVIK
jgi:flavodoxin I